jgi:DNA-binding FadR family transcriptional regulator
LEPLTRQTLPGRVLESLAGFVHEANLAVGDRLPPERDIARQLGVSRALVREALQRWLALGYITRTNGRGTFLARPIPRDAHLMVVHLGTDVDSLLATLEVRRALEPEAAALAARRASPEQVERLRALLRDVETAYAERGDAPDEDWALHQAVYETSGNPLFPQLITTIHHSFRRFWENPIEKPDFARRGLVFHRDLVEAIAAGNPDDARAATLRILRVLEEDLLVDRAPIPDRLAAAAKGGPRDRD